MSSRCPDRALAALAFVLALACPAAGAEVLRVCADPDNLPYSHRDGSGFENRIAAVLADELGAELAIAWTPLQRGFVRKTSNEGLCEVFVEVPTSFERVLTTRPLYRSTYVVVQRAGAPPLAFDDPALATLRIGVQLPGGDFSATAPGHALATRGAFEHVVGFPVIGAQPAAQRMVEAVASGALDAAIVWGPQAGWWVARSATPLALRIAALPADHGAPPAAFSMSVGVVRARKDLVARLDAAIERRRGEIDAILDAYAVPRIASEAER